MLQREVMFVVRQRGPRIGFVLVLLAVALWFGARQPPSPAPDVVLTSSPPPAVDVRVEQEPAAPPPLPEPPPPAPVQIGTGHPCGTELDHAGEPFAEPLLHLGQPIPPHTIFAHRVGAAVDGCTIAVWSEIGVMFSFDGGRRFHEQYVPSISAIAVAEDRIAIVRDRAQLGVVTPPTYKDGILIAQPAEISWHPLGVAAPRGPHNPEHDRGANVRLWLGPDGVIVVDPEADLADQLAISLDDGATWNLFETRPAHHPRVTFSDNRIHLTGFATSDPDVAGGIQTPSRWSARLADLVWEPAALPADRWSYSIETEEHWGCGGTSMLMARKGRRAVKLASGLDGETSPAQLVTSPSGRYVFVTDRLHRIDGARLVDLGVMPTAPTAAEHFPYAGFELAGVDATGAPLAFIGDTLARRTRAGAWRTLAR